MPTRNILIAAQHYADAEYYALDTLAAAAKTVERGWRGWQERQGKTRIDWNARYVGEYDWEKMTRPENLEVHVTAGAEHRIDLDELVAWARDNRARIYWVDEDKWERPTKTTGGISEKKPDPTPPAAA